MRIQRLSTSTFKFYSPEGKVVMVDPWLVNDPLWPMAERTPEKLREIDLIVITHAHFDHASGINEIVSHNEEVFIIAQYEYALSLIRRGINNVIPAGVGATIDFQGMKVFPVSAAHSSSEILPDGNTGMVGTAVGYIIQFENNLRVYASGDTGLTADMKLVVGDYFKPDIAILPVIGMFMMGPEQAACAAGFTGCRYVIPFHDFPGDVSEAANPEAYAEFVKDGPYLQTHEKVGEFAEIINRLYPEIRSVYIPIGGFADVGW